MAVDIEPIRATQIELGVPNDRKHVGQGYVASTNAKHVHSTMRCRSPQDRTKLKLVPLVEDDGQLKAVIEDQEVSMQWCDKCPAYQADDWKSGATCRGTDVDMFTTNEQERADIIDSLCNWCPVVLHCLEFGASEYIDGIWGGAFLPAELEARTRVVNERRKEIGGP